MCWSAAVTTIYQQIGVFSFEISNNEKEPFLFCNIINLDGINSVRFVVIFFFGREVTEEESNNLRTKIINSELYSELIT